MLFYANVMGLKHQKLHAVKPVSLNDGIVRPHAFYLFIFWDITHTSIVFFHTIVKKGLTKQVSLSLNKNE